jgi:hypothetical protein
VHDFTEAVATALQDCKAHVSQAVVISPPLLGTSIAMAFLNHDLGIPII